MNQLYYGDNLDVLRRHITDESVDLVYLDPPFNSNASYNILFGEQDGTKAASQIKAFEDTWEWNQEAARAYEGIVESGGRISQAMQAFRALLGDSDMLAYLAMMAPRLVELRRVLKQTGSLYLHCDTTASHYLKLVLDAIFGPANFRNEIIWKRTSSHNDARRFAQINDCILYYAKTKDCTWNPQFSAPSEHYISSHYNQKDKNGRLYRLHCITRSASMGPRPNLAYEYDGYTPEWGWRTVREKLEAIDKDGRLVWVKGRKGNRMPYLVRYLDEQEGSSMAALWDDIAPVNSQAQERLGYPTQKPEALLERIIAASSNEGDTVLDPFCGCGTAIAAAQKLNRQWIGIDITNLAITLIRGRLTDAFAGAAAYEVIGEPVSLQDAKNLARDDPYQFQWWALGWVGARPVEEKKGADRGIDGRIYFHVGDNKTRQIILSVKAGHVTVSQVRDLRGVIDREHAEIGVLLSMEEPTAPMRKECASAGFYASPWGKHARLQILTIEDLLTGKTIDRPPAQTSVTFKRAPKAQPMVRETSPMPFGESEDSN